VLRSRKQSAAPVAFNYTFRKEVEHKRLDDGSLEIRIPYHGSNELTDLIRSKMESSDYTEAEIVTVLDCLIDVTRLSVLRHALVN
jgi:hypothetical protein